MTVLPLGASPEPLPPAFPDLDLKRVVVTGASLGPGVRLVRAFARNGARLVLQLDADRNGLLAAAHELGPQARGLRVFEGSFRDEDGIGRFAKAAIGAFGGIDVLVNNLGPFPEDLSEARTEADFARIVGRALQTAAVVTQATVSRVAATRLPAVVINVLSLDGDGFAASRALYVMAHASLEAKTRADAEEWGAQGLRINSVAVAAGPHGAGLAEGEDGAPADDEVTAAVLMLASSRSQWMNGLTLSVTGMPE